MNKIIIDILIAAKVELLANDTRATYKPEIKLMVANLMQLGEDAKEIAKILDVDVTLVASWHHQYARRQNFALRNDELSFYRHTNKLVADARTRACLVKACIEDDMTTEEAALLAGVTVYAIEKWKIMYASDYDAMITLKPGREIIVKPTYVLGLEAKEELQTLIYHHDREEGKLAATRRIEFLQNRN